MARLLNGIFSFLGSFSCDLTNHPSSFNPKHVSFVIRNLHRTYPIPASYFFRLRWVAQWAVSGVPTEGCGIRRLAISAQAQIQLALSPSINHRNVIIISLLLIWHKRKANHVKRVCIAWLWDDSNASRWMAPNDGNKWTAALASARW